MLIANERATRSAYPSELQSVMSIAKAQESRDWISSWNSLNPGSTPLYELDGLARSLGIGKLYLKDESIRSDLGSFKALGAPIALARLILRLWPDHNLDPKLLFKGGYRSLLEAFTVISATDGNHGKGNTTNIVNKDQALKAFEAATEYGRNVIVEKYSEYKLKEFAKLKKIVF